MDSKLVPQRPEHPDGIAAILADTCHANHQNAALRREAAENSMQLLVLFLQMANADVPPPPPGHVRAAGFAETPIGLDVLNKASEAAHMAATQQQTVREQTARRRAVEESGKMHW